MSIWLISDFAKVSRIQRTCVRIAIAFVLMSCGGSGSNVIGSSEEPAAVVQKNAALPDSTAKNALPNKGAAPNEPKSPTTTFASDVGQGIAEDTSKSNAASTRDAAVTTVYVDARPTAGSPTTVVLNTIEPTTTSTTQPLPVQVVTPIDVVPPTVTFTRLSPTASSSVVGFVVTGNENLACDTLSLTPGVDFDFIGISSILSITQSAPTICDISVRSSAEADGVSVESLLEKSATFSITDIAGNAQTTMSTALQSTLVTILGVPSAVAAPGVTLGNAQVAVTWSSAVANGSPVSGYNVQKSTSLFATFSDAVGCAGLAVVLSCVASGLTNGVTYYFQVTATNGVGSSVASASSVGVTPAMTYSIGSDGPGGGRVFYVAPSGTTFSCGPELTSRCKYLEVAPPGWSVEVQSPTQVACSTPGTSTEDPKCAWSGNATVFIGTTNSPIGYGFKNTLAIVSQAAGGNTAGRAATASQGYRGGGLTDWHLPTIDELVALCAYARGGACTAGSLVISDYGFSTGTYQTSWEITAGCQRYGYLVLPNQGNCGKTSAARVRPIRAF